MVKPAGHLSDHKARPPRQTGPVTHRTVLGQLVENLMETHALAKATPAFLPRAWGVSPPPSPLGLDFML